MKRSNDSGEIVQTELPKEIWIEIFHVIANQRLLPMRAVSKNWNEWIVKEGLIELTFQKESFMKRMKHLDQYESLTGAHITNQYMTKDVFWKRGL